MRKLFGFLMGLFWVFVVVGSASAIPFSNTIDFSGDSFTADNETKDGIYINDTSNWIWENPGDSGYDFAFSYTHNVGFDPEALSVNNAYLDITFSANQANSVEAWFVYNQGDLSDTQNWVSLGWFTGYTDYDWVTDTFDLSELIAGVSGSTWDVVITIDENTLLSNEEMFLAESRLYGDYEPVPEPATMVLFGLGLMGLAGITRKKFRK